MSETIEGIFNYCARWCERCALWQRCQMGLKERGAGQRARTADQVLDEITEAMTRAVAILEAECRRRGIDPNELGPPPEMIDVPEEHPLLVRATRWMDACRLWLEPRRAPIPTVPPAPPSESEIVDWYHTVVPIKVGRALGGKQIVVHEPDRWDDPLQSDANGSAKVAWLGAAAVLDALTRRYERGNGDLATLDLLQRTFELPEAITAVFPEHPRFHRPGFDDT